MKPSHKFLLSALILTITLLMAACGLQNNTASCPETAQQFSPGNAWSPAERLSVLFTNKESGYTIAGSDLLDTLFIAGALYYDFESTTLLPSGQSRYDDTKAYFLPYRDHSLLQQLTPYMNNPAQDVNGDIVSLLVEYVISGGFSHGVGSPVSQTLEDSSCPSVESLAAGLYAFYQDTNAAEYFRTSALHREIADYIPSAAGEFSVSDLFAAMEAYTGNKENLYGSIPLCYYTILTPYRPDMASFYQFDWDGSVFFVSQQSPYRIGNGTLDIRQTVETAIHESLHMYLNQPVHDRSEFILSLASGLEPEAVTCPMYSSLPWRRITDEAVVRAVQAGIYRCLYQDSQKAYEEILAKELASGIVNLDVMYTLLLEYEQNREIYPSIDDFLDLLITAYYTGL